MANSDDDSPAPEVIPAASVIVFRQGAAPAPEILMVKRSGKLSFAASAIVFPGGRMEAADRELALGLDSGAADAAFRIAAIRELLEETGLFVGASKPVDASCAVRARSMLLEGHPFTEVLRTHALTLDLETLVPFARWLPNHRVRKVYDTCFYLADIGSGQVSISPDRGENTDLFWLTAADALDRIEAGVFKALFPTKRNLERLALFDSFAAAEAHARSIPVRTITPTIVDEDGTRSLKIADDHGYPVTSEAIG